MFSLLAIAIGLLAINLWAIAGGRVVVRLPFGLAVCALLLALLAPVAGLFRVPMPSQFLLLWLLIIPIASVCAVACTLIGLVVQAEQVLAPGVPLRRRDPRCPRPFGLRRLALRRLALLAPIVLIASIAGAEALLPVRLFSAPVRGAEISTGTVAGDVRYGAAFSGTVSGDLDGTLTASANYRPAVPGPATTNTIVGGSWSLAVYKGGRFQGVLFGPLAAGTVRWNADVSVAAMTATMSVSGGTGAYLGAHGGATFTGSLVHSTYPPTVAGTLSLRLR